MLRRTRMATTEADLGAARDQGLEAYLAEQLHPDSRSEPRVRERLKALPYLELPAAAIYRALVDHPQATQVLVRERQRARLLRGLTSKWQLREVMTEFWFNHFNADPRKNEVVACNFGRLEDDLRQRALGKFGDLLQVAVSNPAVLENLDNTVSPGQQVNENFGRELLELYTCGPVYSQAEVVACARLFSGWSYQNDPARPDYLQFRYYPDYHAPGPQVILGQSLEDGQAALGMLAVHPATAHFISRKLVTRFVSDNPPPALVERATQTYLASGGDIAEVLAVILSSPEFREADPKLATPTQFACSALAASGTAEVPEAVVVSIEEMGSPYYCPNPGGWPDRAATWLSTVGLKARQQVISSLDTPAATPQQALQRYLLGQASPETAAALEAAGAEPGQLLDVALTSPDFQER
ncbi:MAG: DUF1800 domain-containing protein [Candidatus Eremiobacteraeota bacterium]|nr:DUF1800 domain-containing protein [Candidatus Eremiobacteraeota bacterium]